MKRPTLLAGVLPKWLGRIGSFIIGAALMYHEVVLADTSEFILVIIALWLMGFPIANVIDAIPGIGDGGKDKGDS